MPPVTNKDKKAIQIGLNAGIRHFALSFANRASDVALMRDLCGPESKIISKIESRSALYNLDKIIELNSFENLKKIELNKGFKEAAVNEDNKKKEFFHLGPMNKWKNLLSNDIITKIETIFKKVSGKLLE